MYHASELAAGSVFPPGRAIVIVLAGFVGFVLASGALRGAGAPLTGAVIGGEAMLVLVPLGFALRGGGDPRALLGLRRPALRFVVGALLIGASQWFLNLVIANLIERHVSLPREGVENLEAAVTRPSLGLALLAIAVMPALCEEVLFRGVLARALATRFVAGAAIALSAVAFSVFHLSLHQAVPTLLLGLVYGYLATRARSCVPTMIAHVVNNGIAIVISRGELPGVVRALDAAPGLAIGGALALTSAGLVLARRIA